MVSHTATPFNVRCSNPQMYAIFHRGWRGDETASMEAGGMTEDLHDTLRG